MWEKLNKEEKNNKFQHLRENEKHNVSLKNNNRNIKISKSMFKSPFIRRVGAISAGLLFVFIVFMCISQILNINWPKSTSVWRTSAHIHVYTYTHLARLAPEYRSSLDQPHAHEPIVQSDKVVSCYYNLPTESKYNQLMPQNIHPYLCTHINVAFARVVNKKVTLDTSQYRYLHDLAKLKQNNPNLKILLSVGGSSDDGGFSDMVVDHASRKVFIKSIKSILRNYTLDGIDLDWEFPALHKTEIGGRERQHFSQLLREIRMEYMREKRDYILTIAAAAPETIVSMSYDIDQVNQYVDYVNIMTYDYHFYTKYTPFTGFNSPLYPRSTEQLYMATLNINYTVHMYIDKGLDRSKIVVGIPTFGHTFTLINANNPRVGSPASGYGILGNFLNFPDVCMFLKNFNDVSLKQDLEAKVPYLYRGKEWISYDSLQSVMEKAKFIKENNLRGAMIYSLNADDYLGICNSVLGHNSTFPLSQSVKNTLLFNKNISMTISDLEDQ